MATPAQPRRRWLRFSLRTLLVAMTILCVWLGLKVNAARRQREAVAAIAKSGAIIRYDYEMISVPGSPNTLGYNPNAAPPGPAWLRGFLGEDFFCDVIGIFFPGSTITESDLSQLAKFPELKSVTFCQMKILTDRSHGP